MPAEDSSSSRPESPGKVVDVTLSLDGIVLASSKAGATLAEMIEPPFDRLRVTLEPRLHGRATPGTLLEASQSLELIDQQERDGQCVLIYRRKPSPES
jgi:hypothetical protein